MAQLKRGISMEEFEPPLQDMDWGLEDMEELEVVVNPCRDVIWADGESCDEHPGGD